MHDSPNHNQEFTFIGGVVTLCLVIVARCISNNTLLPFFPNLPKDRGLWWLSTGAGPRPVQGPSDLFEKLKAEAEKHGVGKYADPNAPKGRRKTKVAVIMRIDQDVPFRQIYEAMMKINLAGFEDVQLRAIKS